MFASPSPPSSRLAQAFELRSGSILPRREVYDAYLAWCGDHNVEATAQSAFGKILHRYVDPRLSPASLLLPACLRLSAFATTLDFPPPHKRPPVMRSFYS
jgi:hypothetical protein